jgi:ankyrin repeat protein
MARRAAAQWLIRSLLVAISASALVADDARAEQNVLPECVHWATAFVFANVMDRARVKGDKGKRLYIHPVNSQLCSTMDSRDCKARAYVIPNDVVVLGHICGAWAYVMYPGGPQTKGWVELDRLERLPEDRDLIYQRNLSNRRPEGPPIFVAAFVGDVAELRRVIASDPEALKTHGVVALYAAARRNQLNAVKALLDLGANPNGESGCHHLGSVAAGSSLDIIDLLVRHGADINCRAVGLGRGYTPLWVGVGQRDTPLMVIANTDRGDDAVWRAMGRVTSPDLFASAKYLLAKGARVNDVNVFGASALRITTQSNSVDIAELLLKGGADVNNYLDGSNPNSSGEQVGHTVLMDAIGWFSLRKDPTMIMLLLKHGADVNYRSMLSYDEECDRTTSGKCTFRGQTALTRAATDGYYTVAKILLENGADPLLPREDGRIPRLVACDWKHVEVALLIKQYEDKMLAESKSAAICPEVQ